MGSTTIELCASCCDPCAALPDSLNVTLADIEACNFCFGFEPLWQSGTALSGINGAFTGLTKVSDYIWRKNIGTVTVGDYSDSECSTPTGETVYSCTIFFYCIDGAYSLQIVGKSGGFPADDSDGTGLWTVSATDLGEAWPSALSCTDSVFIGNGTALVEIPA